MTKDKTRLVFEPSERAIMDKYGDSKRKDPLCYRQDARQVTKIILAAGGRIPIDDLHKNMRELPCYHSMGKDILDVMRELNWIEGTDIISETETGVGRDFEILCMYEPALVNLADYAKSFKTCRNGKGRKGFCAKAVWHGDNNLEFQFNQVVNGRQAKWHDLAYQYIYDCLPLCNHDGSACGSGMPFKNQLYYMRVNSSLTQKQIECRFPPNDPPYPAWWVR